MRNRGLVIAVVLFLGLFAWLRFVEFRPKPPAAAAPDSAFMSVPALNVRSISVAFHADSTTMERRDGRWRIVSPVDYPADPIPVSALLARCEKLPVLRAFPLAAGEEGRYGLDRPSCRVILRESTGRVTTLIFGGPAPASPAFYVQVVGTPRVALLRDMEADDYFRRETTAWRLPRVVEVNPATLTRLTLRFERRVLELGRATPRDPWQVETPFAGPASASVMADFLKGLAHMAASDFPDDHPGPLAAYGLAPAPGEMRFRHADGRADTVWLGAPLRDHVGPPLRYARASGNPVLLAVPANYVTLVQRSDNSFRDRHLLRLGVGQYRSFTFRAEGRSVTLAPDSAGAWRATGTADSATDRRALVESWVVGEADSLLAAPARGGSPAAGPPGLVVEVTGVNSSLQRVEAWPPRSEGGAWPARLISAELPRPGEVFLLPDALVLPALALVRQSPPAGAPR